MEADGGIDLSAVVRCPTSRVPLRIVDIDAAAAELGGRPRPAGRVGTAAIGPTPTVALAERWAYPVVDGIPVLMAPERLYPHDEAVAVDVTTGRFAEAYAEIEPYTQLCDVDANHEGIDAEGTRLRQLRAAAPDLPPWPAAGVWVGGGDEIGAQLQALRHLAPIRRARVLQIGGDGVHALGMLAAGAATAVVVSPIIEELRWCRAVAQVAGLEHRLAVIAGIAEELPLVDDAFDVVYSPASIHHTDTKASFPEIARILAPGGRFSSVDVHRSALYELGIRHFGKRQAGVFCRPLDAARLAPARVLPDFALSWHGAFFRYPLALLARRGYEPSFRWRLRLATAEDRIARIIPYRHRLSTLVCVTATSDDARQVHSVPATQN